MPAAFEASSFLLTYPQCTLAKDVVFTTLSAYDSCVYTLVAQESHADGGRHYHAVLHFSKKQRVGSTFFDIEGFHPNVKSVGRRKDDWERVIAYCNKEDSSPLVTGTPRHAANVWASVATASSREEAIKIIASERPRDLILNARNIDYYLDKVCLVLIYMNTPLFMQYVLKYK